AGSLVPIVVGVNTGIVEADERAGVEACIARHASSGVGRVDRSALHLAGKAAHGGGIHGADIAARISVGDLAVEFTNEAAVQSLQVAGREVFVHDAVAVNNAGEPADIGRNSARRNHIAGGVGQTECALQNIADGAADIAAAFRRDIASGVNIVHLRMIVHLAD